MFVYHHGLIPFLYLCPSQNPKYKPFGFDLVTDDQRIAYPLSADSEKEMDEWIEVLRKATGLDAEEQTGM